MAGAPNLGQAVLLNSFLQMLTNRMSNTFQNIVDLQGELNHLDEMSNEMHAVNDGNATAAIQKWIQMNTRRLRERTTQINNRLKQLDTSYKMDQAREQTLEQQRQRALGS